LAPDTFVPALEKADIREYEEQDGKILYKVKPLKSPVG
jgi:hypothetical protein